LQAVVNLPSGVFKPYSGVGTAALIFENVAPGFRGCGKTRMVRESGNAEIWL